jgi:folate-binding protein YgfZ
MLATFLVTRSGVGYLLQLPRVLVEPIAARLQKYVLRAKVTLTDASDTIALLGLGGPRAAELIATVLGEAPTGPLQVVSRDGVTVIALEGECYELTVAPERAAALWDQLSEVAHPAGGSAWEWRRIAAGIPWITPATQEAFVPQMANLEQVGAVSFSKGCYPGQEIVARAQYLGEVKRRLFRGHSDGQSAEGQELFALAGSTQSIGMVVNAAPAPGGGTDFLAVVQTEVAESGGAHVGGFSGPRVLLTAVAQPQAA